MMRVVSKPLGLYKLCPIEERMSRHQYLEKIGLVPKQVQPFLVPEFITIVNGVAYDVTGEVPIGIWQNDAKHFIVNAYYNKVQPVPPKEIGIGMHIRQRTPLELAKVGVYIDHTYNAGRGSFRVCYQNWRNCAIDYPTPFSEGIVVDMDDTYVKFRSYGGRNHIQVKFLMKEVQDESNAIQI